jgi:hypothetical protein
VLPDCWYLSERQAEALSAYLDAGGTVVVVGRFGDNLPPERREALLAHGGVRSAETNDADGLVLGERQVEVTRGLGVNIARLADGSAAVHLVNYTYDADADAVRRLDDVDIVIRLPFDAAEATFLTSGEPPRSLSLAVDAGVHRVRVPQLGVYGVVVLATDVRSEPSGQPSAEVPA